MAHKFVIFMKNIILVIIIFSLILNLSCNSREKKDGKTEEKFTNILEIKISGYYGYFGRGLYEYEINSNVHNKLTIHFTRGENKLELYNKILSDNEMKNIYELIKKFDLNKEIGLSDSMWIGSHDFYGTISINIDNIIYNKKIFAGQDVDSDIYKILRYLNMFVPKESELPIRGVYDETGDADMVK